MALDADGTEWMNDQFHAARERRRSPADAGRALSRRELAELVRAWVFEHRGRDTPIDEVHVGKIERGEIRWPNVDYRAAFRSVLGASADSDLGFRMRPVSTLPAYPDVVTDPSPTGGGGAPPPPLPVIDGIEAIELLQRIEATDLGPRTLAALATSVDHLCRDYTHVAPFELLPSLVSLQLLIGRLLDGRSTLAQRRELLSQAGWLSLLVATADVDLGRDRAADANFATAAAMATEVGDLALSAAVHETQAWQALSRGQLPRAAEHCRAGLALAPARSSAFVQLCTQLARVSAKLGDRSATYEHVDAALAAVDHVSPPPNDDGREHHFVCDEGRVVLHSAAALVWLSQLDDSAEDLVRQAVAHYEGGSSPMVHHQATARMNLALFLAIAGQPAEAAATGARAVAPAWRLCQTDLFLADDLDRALTNRYGNATEVVEFHERYLAMRADVTSHTARAALPELTGPGSV